MLYALGHQSPAPTRVHERALELTGHRATWIRRAYRGGITSTEHYRTCSYCGCIHPVDMIELLRAGESTLERTSKCGKHLLVTPNPVAGQLVRMGSMPGSIFDGPVWRMTIRHRLMDQTRVALEFVPDMTERLAGHFERPCLEPAPAMIRQSFYAEHTTEPQWAEIEAAAEGA